MAPVSHDIIITFIINDALLERFACLLCLSGCSGTNLNYLLMLNRLQCVTFYLINLVYTVLIYKVTAAVKLNGVKYTVLFYCQI